MKDAKQLKILRDPVGKVNGVTIYRVPDQITVTRGLLQRLFEKPWRPGVKTELIDNPIAPPAGTIWKLSDHIIVRASDCDGFLDTMTDAPLERIVR